MVFPSHALLRRIEQFETVTKRTSTWIQAMEQSHRLVEIPPKDWPHLQSLFAPNWPEHILGFSIVGNYIEWLDKSGRSEIKHLKFFSLDGDWQSDGTFLVIVGGIGFIIIITYYSSTLCDFYPYIVLSSHNRSLGFSGSLPGAPLQPRVVCVE